jgi:hypothetical protein
MTFRLAPLAFAVFAFVAAGPISAGVAHAQSKCAGTKRKEAGKKADRKLKCWSKGVKRGVQADPNCLSKATLIFNSKWDKAEAKGGCTTTGDKSAIETKVDAFVNDVVDELAGSPAGSILTTDAARTCAAAKIKAAGKKASSKLKCYGKAAQKGIAVDPNCLLKATSKFSSKWDKAEAKGGCATTGDKMAIETKVDAFVLDASAELPPNSTTTTTTASTSTTTTTVPGPCGNGDVDPGEECDGSNLGGATCASGSPGGGFLPTCTASCTLDCSTCPGGLCAATCVDIVPGQPIANTYVLTGIAGPKICTTSSAANALGHCSTDADCGGTSGGCLQTPWVTADGFAFPFPQGIKTTFTVAAADSAPTCSHAACISCGDPNAVCTGIPGCGTTPGSPEGGCSKNTCCDTPGFTVPTFNIPILGGLCGRVDQNTCGTGVVNSSRPQTGDNEVTKVGDTSDPGPDCTYGTLDDPAPKLCTPIGAGADTKGKITRSVGNGSADVAGIHFRILTPMLTTVWQDSSNPCPDGSTYDAGESLVAQLILNAEPSSAGMTGSFQDLSGDGCARGGSGFSSASPNGPISLGPAVAQPQSYDGTTGPIQVAGGPVFSGAAPLYDIGFVAILPSGPAAVAPAETCSCVPVAGCPE